MAPSTTLKEFDKPVKLNDVLAEQSKDYDCLPCRVMGSAAFTGLGIYSYGSGMSQLKKREQEILRSGSRIGMAPRRFAVFATSAVLVGVGVYRLRN